MIEPAEMLQEANKAISKEVRSPLKSMVDQNTKAAANHGRDEAIVGSEEHQLPERTLIQGSATSQKD